jgi:hypothetical protein
MVVESGFLYLPLLFDPEMDREVRDFLEPGGSVGRPLCGATLKEVEGRLYIRSLNVRSLVANYDRLDRDTYEQVKRSVLQEPSQPSNLPVISPDGKLHTIVLKVMPHFVRKSRGFERRSFSEEEFLDLLSSALGVPDDFMEETGRILDSGVLQRRLEDLRRREGPLGPLQDGPITGEAFLRWVRRALEEHVLSRERESIEVELAERERMSDSKRRHIAAMLYLAGKGSFELGGFGFFRTGMRDDYVIYKRTGEYVLKDYYGQSYRFPDCRVAVSTAGPLRPFVLDSYKHPFLLHHAPKQEICLRGYEWPRDFTAENIIRLLEDGINALLYGYDPRRRNGYHSLDKTLYYVKSIEFGDYRI